MQKNVKGEFTRLDGQEFYKISNYDCMEDFFMTITSSSDVWNFLWSHGGITAGRIDANHAIFPYYTADKVSDAKTVTGSYTAICVKKDGKTEIWEPFAPLLTQTGYCYKKNPTITRNLYKNPNGTCVWFEEINNNLNLVFRYGWTSSAKFGLVKTSIIQNLSSSAVKFSILDGTRNILPADINSDLQANSSSLLDAYKKTDYDEKSKLSLFTLSSVLTDKAEPSEGLLANTSWFTTNDNVYINPDAIKEFIVSDGNISTLTKVPVLKGKRASCFIAKETGLAPGESSTWQQVFDTFLNASRVAELKNTISDRQKAVKLLAEDIAQTENLMTAYISEADGIQGTAQEMTCVHHRANVMFNIMRGGFFADNGKINGPDFIKFIGERNKALVEPAKNALGELAGKYSVQKEEIQQKISDSKNPQLLRLYLEYLPMIFSRRHGDPSRPWNKFSIKLNDPQGNPILNYEGNWRDIFQNWEALAWSYPAYIKNMCAKFLNAMTADGFNPYRISRDGVDWECPDPTNPWAQFGYWGDHQVIYLTKLLEFWDKTDRESLLNSLDEQIYSSSNIPYRLKSYAEVVKDPRNSLYFDKELSDRLNKEAKEKGSDAKLISAEDGSVALVSLTAKLLQIVITKATNLVPGGGIWMNTQRPEWNDANNALAGYGLSVVTTSYLYRMIKLLLNFYNSTEIEKFTIPSAEAQALSALCNVYSAREYVKAVSDEKTRKNFTENAYKVFEDEYTQLYKYGYKNSYVVIEKKDIIDVLEYVLDACEKTISANKKDNGLYHTYNTLVITDTGMRIKYLQEMLEGQVAVLSAGLLSPKECVDALESLKKSDLYEPRQKSYILYPNKELPLYLEKNNISEEDLKTLLPYAQKTEPRILQKDVNSVWHFNEEFHNARLMQDYIETLPQDLKPTEEQLNALLDLYELKFNHQAFTGRSGTFYAYEGLGSIYWHMCSKLLLAVQENAFAAYKEKAPEADRLKELYYDVRQGLSFNKTPDLYGAFPSDPYSHTPYGQGAKQPGMTGQVKEEVLTRFGELGLDIKNGKALFNPLILNRNEFFENGKLSFTWCGIPVEYTLKEKAGDAADGATVTYADGKTETFANAVLSEECSKLLFNRSGKIKKINVTVK